MSSSGEAAAGLRMCGYGVWYLRTGYRLQAAGVWGDAENDLYLSAASCWEIVIKYQLGKR